MTRTHRSIAAVVGVTLLVGALAVTRGEAQEYRDYRSERGDAGKVRGPISDFWFKVRSEWAGYLQSDPELPPEGGFLQNQRTRQPVPPNRVWVSLVHGDRLARGGDNPITILFQQFLDEWQKAESRNWPYAQIHVRPWSRMGTIGRRQNIIMIGTPWELPPVGALAASVGLTIEPGLISIGERRYRGDNLVLVFIAPNPDNREKYALVITGTRDEALLQAGHLPYGDSDYVVFRGRRLLEAGFFRKELPAASRGASNRVPGDQAWGSPEEWSARGSHSGFSIRETPHYTLWYETGRLDRKALEELVREKEAAWEELTRLVPSDAPLPRPVWYLYSSLDRKVDETGRDEVVHVELAAAEVHTVFSRTQRIVEPYLDIQLLLHAAIGPSRVPRLERALAIALSRDFQGRELRTLAARALEDADRESISIYRSIRDQSVLTPADSPPTSLDIVLAGFLHHMISIAGRAAVFDFVADASPQEMGSYFQRTFGSDLRESVARYATSLREERKEQRLARGAGGPGTAGDGAPLPEYEEGVRLMYLRRDDDAADALRRGLSGQPGHAASLAALSRVNFRNGRFDEAESNVRRLLQVCSGETARAGCFEAEAWGRLTLGRVEAVRGHLVSAHVELTHPAVIEGPDPVPTLAEFWLETMGRSRNQLTVVSHLKRGARVSLRRLEWDQAEADLKRVLEIDPTDGEAHRLLSEVYHKQHEYWAWMTRYLNQVHPDYNIVGRVWLPGQNAPVASRVQQLHSLDSHNDLVLRGNLELLKAQSLYAIEIQNLHAEGDRYLIEQRDIVEALEIYRRALDLNPEFFLSHFLVGRCYFLLSRFEEARRSFEEVIFMRPADSLVMAWTHTYLGYMALEEDDFRTARRAFRDALGLAGEGKVAMKAREGLDRIDTILLLLPDGPP